MFLRRFLLLIAMVFVCGFSVSAHATLLDNGDGTITDDSTNLMWLQNANLAGALPWNSAVAWADGLSYAGHDDWRLPTSDTCYSYYCTGSEMGYMYYTSLGKSAGGPLTNTSPFTNVMPDFYWSGTEYALYPNYAWNFDFGIGYQYNQLKNTYYSAWAVRDMSAVPEPTSLLLLGTGLIGLIGLRRKLT